MNRNKLSKIWNNAKATDAVGIIVEIKDKDSIFVDIDLHMEYYESRESGETIMRFKKGLSTSDKDIELEVKCVKSASIRYE